VCPSPAQTQQTDLTLAADYQRRPGKSSSRNDLPLTIGILLPLSDMPLGRAKYSTIIILSMKSPQD